MSRSTTRTLLLALCAAIIVAAFTAPTVSIPATAATVTAPAGAWFTGGKGGTPEVTVTGVHVVGDQLTASATTHTESHPAVLYQWLRDGTPIPGATAASYTQQTADMAKEVSVRATATGVVTGDSWSKSSSTALTRATPAPTVTGSRVAGAVLTLTQPDIYPLPTKVTYQWFRDSAAIPGSTGTSYTQTDSDIGHVIGVTTTAAINSQTRTWKSAAAAATGGRVFTGTLTVSASGARTVGQTLTAAVVSSLKPTATLTFQWFRDSTAIAGATASTYLEVRADVGRLVTVRATATAVGFQTKTATSAAPAKTADAPVFVGNATPTITGTRKIGSTLTAVKAPSWDPAPTTLTYQWTRNGAAISGATKATYMQVAADAGKTVNVKVAGKRTGYATRTWVSVTTGTTSK